MTNCLLIVALATAYVPANSHEPLGFVLKGRVLGIPDWMTSKRYNIDAQIAESDAVEWQKPMMQITMLRAMMRSLLVERCKLVVHREMRNKPVYALVVGKNGPKLKPAESTDPEKIRAKHPNAMAIPGGGGMVAPGRGRGGMEFFGASMATLALVLSDSAGRPVVDKTGLTSKYDLKLEMQQPGVSAADEQADSEPSVFAAVQEQLGLKLEPQKDQVEVLVIDHMERPTEN